MRERVKDRGKERKKEQKKERIKQKKLIQSGRDTVRKRKRKPSEAKAMSGFGGGF